MSQFGNTLFSGSRFLFWTLCPILLSFSVVMPIIVEAKGIFQNLMLYTMSATVAFLALGLFNPTKFKWALRLVSGIVFWSYLAYLTSEIIEYSNGTGTLSSDRATPSVLTALAGLIFIGYPSLKFMLLGRLSGQEVEEPDEDLEEYGT